MAVFELKKEDVDALITGLAILGTGGGGDPCAGNKYSRKSLLQKKIAGGRHRGCSRRRICLQRRDNGFSEGP